MSFRGVTEKIRDVSPINEILEERNVELRCVSQGWMCRCPLPEHADRMPSFSISADGCLFHCFGCGKGGDVFRLVELLDGVSFLTARKTLARRAGIRVPDRERRI
jgi:DNA primase